MKSNLEPIEERDLDLEGKLRRPDMGISAEQEKNPYYVETETPQEISAAEKDDSYVKILSKVQTEQAEDVDYGMVASDAQDAHTKMDAETQVQHLVDLASQKGVIHAVKVAKHMQDNYVLDTFHDRMLGEELHDALVKKGLIKEI